jgi:hypothetical protein
MKNSSPSSDGVNFSKELFENDFTIYWPQKYETIIEFLKNGSNSELSDQSFFKTNVEVLVFAACIGVSCNEKFSFKEKEKQIDLITFINNDLASYLFMIPFLAQDEPDLHLLMNDIGEQKSIQLFQDYAAGGLRILNDEYVNAGLKSPYLFVKDIITKYGEPVQHIPLIKEAKIDIF